MFQRLKRRLIGRPLKNEALHGEKYSVVWGLPILASDALSSVAYAGEAMLLVLIPTMGIASFKQMAFISCAIIGLLFLLMLSYSQTIENYPNGGGAYHVAKENLGVFAGVAAGAALSVDYILTVALSVAAGIDQLVSIVPIIEEYKVLICIVVILLLMVGNLRGIRESSRIFSIPTYAFIFGIFTMIIVGLIKYMSGYHFPSPADIPIVKPLSGVALIFLTLKAFSSGCTALTGVEAVSNSVTSFKNPATKNAKTVLRLLALIVLLLFGGTSVLANIIHVTPLGFNGQKQTVLVSMAAAVFGNSSFMYFFISISTFLILTLAANTAFSGFPMLISVMAREGYAPRQLSMRGDRLSYSNGILFLSAIAILLTIVFHGKVASLLGLYAIGVFISFTLSQSGMFVRWYKKRGQDWKRKAFINGLGAVVTSIVVLIIAKEKFFEGVYLVVLLIPILMFFMMKVKKHYIAVSKQLRLEPEQIASVDITRDVYTNRIIVPIESINKASIRALRYARTISNNVIAFNVSIDEESGQKVREKYGMIKTDIPLIIKYSPFRKIVEPLMKFVESAEYDYKKGDITTVILPQFAVKHWWQRILHNQTRATIEREVLKRKHIVLAIMPLQLKDDGFVLKSHKYN